MYEVIELEQGSPEWHEFRSNHIGGSDAPIIMGLSPWMSEIDLWRIKMGFKEPQPMTNKMQRGHDLEPVAREWYEGITGIKFNPIVMTSKSYHFMSASLDGINNVNPLYMIEIKCPNKDTHDLAIEGVIKDYYMCQIQHCLFVSGVDSCSYISYRPESTEKYALIVIKRNEEMIEKIIDKEKRFWYCMCNMIEPEGPWKFKKK